MLTISQQINNSVLTRREKNGENLLSSAAPGHSRVQWWKKEAVIFFFNYKRQIFIIYKYLPCMGLNVIYEPVA